MDKMIEIVDKIYCELLKVKKSEKILILFDRKTKKIAEYFLEFGISYGKHILCLEIKEGERDGSEPEKNIADLMLKYDVLLLITNKSLSHTNARKKASAKGARIITMPGIREDTLRRCVDIDYRRLCSLHKKIFQQMKKAKEVRITTKPGTDLKFGIYNNKIEYDISIHKKGNFHNIPLGEVFVPPKEGSAEGTYIVDASQGGVGKVGRPIKISVKNGVAIKIEGDKKAVQLKRTLESVKSRKAYNIAEFGIGTNPKAKITGNILEDEKVKGTCHIALGNNYSFGGKVNVPVHLDGIMRKPTIYFDEKIIMKNGRIMI